MTNTNYTSLEISKLIHEKVPEVETEKKHLGVSNNTGTPWYYSWRIVPSEDGVDYPYNNGREQMCQAYTLNDVIRAIKVWGEKQEWGGQIYQGDDDKPRFVSQIEIVCHRLLEAYLPTLSMQGEEVERVIRDIFA